MPPLVSPTTPHAAAAAAACNTAVLKGMEEVKLRNRSDAEVQVMPAAELRVPSALGVTRFKQAESHRQQ